MKGGVLEDSLELSSILSSAVPPRSLTPFTLVLLFLTPQANYWSLLFLFPLLCSLFPQLSAGLTPHFLQVSAQSLPRCHIIFELFSGHLITNDKFLPALTFSIPLTLLYFSAESLDLSGSEKPHLCLFIPSLPLKRKL